MSVASAALSQQTVVAASATASISNDTQPYHQQTTSYGMNYYSSTTSQSSTASLSSSSASSKRVFACLYTKHKTQKRKVWQDGRLVLTSCRAVLYNANPPPGSGDPALDQCELSRSQMDAIARGQEGKLEMEKFLLTVEGPWLVAASTAPSKPKPVVGPSTSMKKVLTKKFQRPSRNVPPPPPQQQQQTSVVLAKRKRPLQPGELHRQYYGGNQYHQQMQGPYAPNSVPPLPPAGSSNRQPYDNRPPTQQGEYEIHQGSARVWHENRPSPHYQPPIMQQQPTASVAPSAPTAYSQQKQQSVNAWEQERDQTYAQHASMNRTTENPQFPIGDGRPVAGVVTQPPAMVSDNINPSSLRRPLDDNNGRASGGRAWQQNTATLKETGIFHSGNGFDPSSFYGEDVEEEDDDDEEETAQEFQLPERSNQLESARPSNLRSDSYTGPTSGDLRPSSKNNDAAGGALSRNELLDLFGAGPAQTAAQGSVGNPTAPAEEANGGEFVLPPADSSSDEDDSEQED